MTLLQPTAPRWQANYDLGWIGFIHHHSLLADLICYFTRWWRRPNEPCVSHVFIVSGQRMCIESVRDGVDTNKLSAYFNDPRYTVFLRRPRSWTPDVAVCAATEAIRSHAASACLLAAGAVLIVHALQQSHPRK